MRLALVCSALTSGPALFVPLDAAEPATVPVTIAPAATASAATPEGIPVRPAEELDELLGPIALYPDVLIALILPAATLPADITRAATFLQANGNPNELAQQPWDPSVQALAHYPEIVRWMNENLPWTQQVGDAFTVQAPDVMRAIQRLRGRAIASGALVSTAEQTVINENGEIRIVPAQPEAVYVPRYEPAVVYADVPAYAYSSSLSRPVYFGAAFATGSWLVYDLNWDTYGIWISPWRPRYDYRNPAWRRPPYGPPIVGRPWHPVGPPPPRPGWTHDQPHHRPPVVRPPPLPGTPPRPPGFAYQPPPGVNPNPRYGGVSAQPDSPPGDRHPAPPGRGRNFGPRVEPAPGGGPAAPATPAPAPTNPDPRHFPTPRPGPPAPMPGLAPLPVRPAPVATPTPAPAPEIAPPAPAPDRPERRQRPEGSQRNRGDRDRERGNHATESSPTPLPRHNTPVPASVAPNVPATPPAIPTTRPPVPGASYGGGNYNRSGGNSPAGNSSDGSGGSRRYEAPRATPPAAAPAQSQHQPTRPAPPPATQPSTEQPQPGATPPTNNQPTERERRRNGREG